MAEHLNWLIINKLYVLKIIILSTYIISSLFLFTEPYAFGQLQEQKIDIPLGASEVTNKHFSPQLVGINAGTLVRWVNNDNSTHTVTFATAGIYDSGLITPNQNVTHVFLDQGTFDYFCKIHPFMTATITVS